MVKTRDVLELVDGLFPFSLAESWDNCGLQAGMPSWPVHRILAALDVSIPVLEHAVRCGANMVLTHHPLIMKGEKQLDFSRMPGAAISFAARNEISIVAAHTNLDKAWQGLNDYVAAKMGLRVESVFLEEASTTNVAGKKGSELQGLGRICSVPFACNVRELTAHIKQSLHLANIRLIGTSDRKIERIAICTGSGGSLVDVFLRSDAQVYITGDIKYHEARDIEDHGKMALDIGHFGSEHPAVELLVEKLSQGVAQVGYNIEIQGYTEEKDPFIIV